MSAPESLAGLHQPPSPADRRGAREGLSLLVLMLVVAAALRFASIGAKSLWFDEAYSVDVASRPAAQVIGMVARGDTHPPLYYVLLSLWIGAFGSSEAALRSLGAVMSVGTVGGTWWLGTRLGGPLVGKIAAFLTAVAPLQVMAAQEARMYPLLGLLTLLSWAALLLATDGKRWAWIAYGAATTLALYTHYFGMLILVGQAVYVLGAAGAHRQRWLISQLAILILYLPWTVPLLNTVFSGRGWPFFRRPVGPETVTSLLGMLNFGGHAFGFDGFFGGMTASLGAQLAVLTPFLGLIVVGVASRVWRPKALWVITGYLAAPVLVAFAFSLRHNVFYTRYFSFVFPAYAVLLAFGVVAVGRRVPAGVQRVGVLVVVLALLAFNAPVLDGFYTNPKLAFFNWRGAAALLTQEAGPDDLIVTIPGFGHVALKYYFKGSQRVFPLTPRELFNITTGQVEHDPAAEAHSRKRFRTFAADHRVMWIVATMPFPTTAIDRLRGLLDGIYDVRGVADFNGVALFKTVRHPDWLKAP